jgi:hypothetical protein
MFKKMILNLLNNLDTLKARAVAPPVAPAEPKPTTRYWQYHFRLPGDHGMITVKVIDTTRLGAKWEYVYYLN